MRLALWQGPSPQGDLAQGIATVKQMLIAAGAAGAQMAVFPEVFLPGYNIADPGIGARTAEEWQAELSPLAKAAGCGLTIGLAERAGGELYNSALCLDATGAVLALYRKTQLFGPREARFYRPGREIPLFRLGGKICALLICYDIEFAPLIRDLAGRGVELILCPTANMTPFTHVPRLTVPSQAVNHAVAIAYANYCGVEGDLAYVGCSVLVNADGAILARAGDAPALLIADLRPPDPVLLSTQLADFRPL